MKAIEKVELPFLHLTFRSDLDILFCRWRRFVTFQEYQEGYWLALELAEKYRARFWLHDLRLRNTSDNVERQWYDNQFVPALTSLQPSGFTIAYLMSPMQRRQLVSEINPVSDVIRYGKLLQLRYFISEHDALDWLQECRERTMPLH